jgi:hypothetical protein
MFGVHVTVVWDYGSYTTVSLSKKGKARIWLELENMPKATAVSVVCARCGKTYFIKWVKPKVNK